MLAEIFQTISQELHDFLDARKVKTRKFVISGKPGKKPRYIRLELLRFGSDVEHKNYIPNPPSAKSFHSFTFFVLAETPQYDERLELTELICEHFDKKPFVQVKINEKEYEMALSPIELSIDEINKFWIAQKQTPRPVLFYQARISEI
jgi:hypothetical protein